MRSFVLMDFEPRRAASSVQFRSCERVSELDELVK